MLTLVHLSEASAGVTAYRAGMPYRFCFEQLYTDGVELVPSRSLLDSRIFECVYLQRQVTPAGLVLLRKWKSQGKRFIWGLDDNIFNLPAWSPAVKQFDPAILAETLELADTVCVSTEPLARVVGPKAVVCPNLVDPLAWRLWPRRGRPPIRVVWSGSGYHAGDLGTIRQPLLNIIKFYGRRVRWIWFGWVPEWLRGLVEYVPPVALEYYPALLCSLKGDIGLAPLEANEFNESKSAIKYYEYTLAGMATVASPVGPYKIVVNNVDGILADHWEGELSSLIEDAEARRRLASNALHRVCGSCSWYGDGREAWLDLFRSQ
jgi:hypothetical protein